MKAPVADEEDDPGKRARQVAALKELFNSPLVKAITEAGYAPQILLDDLPVKPGQGYNADQVLLDEMAPEYACPHCDSHEVREIRDAQPPETIAE
jgi:hypothetical protein